ncbi:hypothetical protein Tco_1146199 [Tanacetum coccineum]
MLVDKPTPWISRNFEQVSTLKLHAMGNVSSILTSQTIASNARDVWLTISPNVEVSFFKLLRTTDDVEDMIFDVMLCLDLFLVIEAEQDCQLFNIKISDAMSMRITCEYLRDSETNLLRETQMLGRDLCIALLGPNEIGEFIITMLLECLLRPYKLSYGRLSQDDMGPTQIQRWSIEINSPYIKSIKLMKFFCIGYTPSELFIGFFDVLGSVSHPRSEILVLELEFDCC